MYNNPSSPIVVITSKTLKKDLDTPQTSENKEAAIKKARKDLKKAGLRL